MTINYLPDSWANITRDERYFCAELFQIIKANKAPFSELLKEKGIIKTADIKYEIGFEVCFYRDYVFHQGYTTEGRKEHHIKKILVTPDGTTSFKFKPKRTFDLCLFLKDEIIIIEAKSQQGFDNNQLSDFNEDRILLNDLLENKAKITIIALVSGDYTPKQSTLDYFDKVITWKEVYQEYMSKANNSIINKSNYQFLKRANSVFKLKAKC
jgi:hypothetical protein